MKLTSKRAISLLSIALFSSSSSLSAQYWKEETGGLYNIPAKEYNSVYTGYGSKKNLIYNKIDLHTGKNIEITEDTDLYDALGNKVDTAVPSPVGWDHVNATRDGGLIAASLSEIEVDGTKHIMAYAWSVNTPKRKRKSGWIRIDKLSPSTKIQQILADNKKIRTKILIDAGVEKATYKAFEVVEAFLPKEAAQYYLMPNRAASYTAGKAKYYYTRDNYISGIKNIPETKRQRYGVAHNNIPLKAKFYVDTDVEQVDIKIYPPSSTKPIEEKLELVWGYMETNTGEKIYSWVNRKTLSPLSEKETTK